MKKLIILLIFTLFYTAKASEMHPYHVGSVEIKYSEKSKTFQIIAKFFVDDLENAVNKKFGTKLFFFNEKQLKEMNQRLENYCLSSMKMKINNQITNIQYIGFKENKEMVQIYLESEKVENPKKIETEISMLYNLFDDQITIIHIIYNKQRKSHKLSYPERYMSYIIKE